MFHKEPPLMLFRRNESFPIKGIVTYKVQHENQYHHSSRNENCPLKGIVTYIVQPLVS